MDEAYLIVAIFGISLVLVVNQLSRIVRMSMLHRTIRQAITSNNAAFPALLDGIEEKSAPPSDDRTGLILVALGLATFLFGLIQGEADSIRNMAAIAVFPALVGAALLGRFWYQSQRGNMA
jgi:hypothetical protein